MYDGRTTIRDFEGGDLIGDDPSMIQLEQVFAGGLQVYLSEELGLAIDRPYRVINFVENENWSWDDYRPKDGHYDIVTYLAEAMKTTPGFHVMAISGLYDLHSPYFGAMRGVKIENWIDDLAMPIAQTNIFRHRHVGVECVVFTERDANSQIDARLHGRNPEEKFQELISKSVLLKRWQHIDS